MAKKTRSRRWGQLLVIAAIVLAAVAIWAPATRQREDREHLEAKEKYLARLASTASPRGPNLVVILFDDLGYGDWGVYGSRSIRTPHLDRLAAEGLRFTDAYSTSPYCSASRAGLLTGRYAVRSGLDHVLQPRGTVWRFLLRLGGRNRWLPEDEITLSEILQASGWTTAAFGKWHLGDGPSLPMDRGFDRFYGLLHSNDQGEPVVWDGREVAEEHPIDQTTLTRRYTERAVAFVEEERDRPFFLYLPHTFPHIPLHVADDRLGHSPGGLYGDVVEELDWSVGQVLDALDRSGHADDTLVVVTSDNGPWFQGSGGPTRGRKLDIFEGGMRVPLVFRWPGRIAPGRVTGELAMGIDLLPTVLEVAGLEPPGDRFLDGLSLWPLLARETDAGPHDALYFIQLRVLKAVRSGRFKYHDRHGVFYGNPMDWPVGAMKRRGPWLFDLELDPTESYDVSAHRPEVVEHLRWLFETRRDEMAENPRGWR